MVGRYDRQLCSRSLVVFNPLLVGQSTSLSPHDDGAISPPGLDPVAWLFLLWPLLNPAKAFSGVPHRHINLQQPHGQKRINAQLPFWNGTGPGQSHSDYRQGPTVIENLPDKKFQGNWYHYLPQSLLKCWVQQRHLRPKRYIWSCSNPFPYFLHFMFWICDS